MIQEILAQASEAATKAIRGIVAEHIVAERAQQKVALDLAIKEALTDAVQDAVNDCDFVDTRACENLAEQTVENALEAYPAPDDILTNDGDVLTNDNFDPSDFNLLTKDDFDPDDYVSKDDFDTDELASKDALREVTSDLEGTQAMVEQLRADATELRAAHDELVAELARARKVVDVLAARTGAFDALSKSPVFLKFMAAFGVEQSILDSFASASETVAALLEAGKS